MGQRKIDTETDWEKGNNVVREIFSGQASRNKAKGRMRWEGSMGDRAKVSLIMDMES